MMFYVLLQRADGAFFQVPGSFATFAEAAEDAERWRFGVYQRVGVRAVPR